MRGLPQIPARFARAARFPSSVSEKTEIHSYRLSPLLKKEAFLLL